MQLTFDAALKKWKGARELIIDFRKKEKLVTGQLASVNAKNVGDKSDAEKQQIYQWILNNTNWLINHRDDYELATKLVKITEAELYSLSEDFETWAKLFNLGTEQDS